MKPPQPWIEEPIFDAGEIAKMPSEYSLSSMVGALPKKRDDADAAAVKEFLATRIVRPTAKEQRASEVRANKRGQGRKDIEKVMSGWSSHRAARAMPNKAEIEAMEAGCGTWAVTADRPLNEPGDTPVSFPKVEEIPEYVFAPPVVPIVIPGRCAHVDCGKAIPRGIRLGTKFCSDACKSADHRSRNAKIIARLAFKSRSPVDAEAVSAALVMEQLDIDGVVFLATAAGVLVDGHLPALIFEDVHDRRPDSRVEVHETWHRTHDEDIIDLVMAAREKEVAWRRGCHPSYLALVGDERLNLIDIILTGPDRDVRLLTFDPGMDLRCRLDVPPADETEQETEHLAWEADQARRRASYVPPVQLYNHVFMQFATCPDFFDATLETA